MVDAASSDTGTNATRTHALSRLLEPPWRRVLVAGWVLFAVSFLLPTLVNYVQMPTPSGGEPSLLNFGSVVGWEAFLWALGGVAGPPGVISAVTNLLVLGGVLHGRWSPVARWPVFVLTAATLLNASFWPFWVVSEGDKSLQVGYFVWVASFACVTVAFWLRRRGETATPVE